MSEASSELVALLRSCEFDSINPRIASAIISAIGWDFDEKRRECINWPGESKGVRPRWADHGYTIKVDGVKEYHGHPYQLSGDDIQKLAELQRNGWSVYISGASQYFPGWTFHVVVIKSK